MALEQNKYIEETKEILISFLKSIVPESDVVPAFPDITGKNFSLKRPLLFVEFEREVNLDIRRGRHDGNGRRIKRKQLTFSFQVITTGDNKAIMQRDRIIQKIINGMLEHDDVLSGKGLRKAEAKYTGSFRVREGIHLARIDFYGEIKFINKGR